MTVWMGRDLRVLVTTDALGGVWDYALELSRSISAAGGSILLACMGPAPTPAQVAEARRIRGLDLEHLEVRLEWMDDPDADLLRAEGWLMRLERRWAPAVVHINGYVQALLPWHAPVVLVAHSCVISWWRAVRGEPPPPTWSTYRARVAASLRAAPRVVSPTRAFLRTLEGIYGAIPHGRVIPNGRDVSRYKPRAKSDFIFSAGRLWDEAKNVAAVDAVAPGLDWPVFLAGDPRSPDGGTWLPRHARALGQLSPTEMAHWLSHASVVALPCRYEPFGLVALEAALSGCALVLGDIPTFRELWEGAACFVPSGDHGALRTAIQALVMDPRGRTRLGRAARRRALALDATRMGQGYLSLYKDLLGHSQVGLAGR